MGAVEDRLAELGLALPEVAAPLAAYVPTVESDGLVWMSGQLPLVKGKVPMTGKVGAEVWGFAKDRSGFRVTVTDARGIVVFDSGGKDTGRDDSRWNDVYLTLRGKYGARSTRDDPGDPDSTVMHVAAPIYDPGHRIIGVLTVAKPNRAMAPFIARSQNIIARWGFVLMGVALLAGLVAAWWLSRQLGALRRYADAVSAGRRAPQPRAAGEFGDLGRALHDMREKLEGKQYVEQYVHALTHELKSPLAAIRGATELLEQPLPAADRARFVASIRAQGERMAQMVDKLLALAAVEHRQKIEQPQRVDAAALLHEAADALAQRADAAGVELRVEAPAPAMLQGDGFLLRQALNLFLTQLKGRLPMTFLAGYRTYIIAAIMLLTGLAGALGIDIPNFTGQVPGDLIIQALAFIFLRHELKLDSK